MYFNNFEYRFEPIRQAIPHSGNSMLFLAGSFCRNFKCDFVIFTISDLDETRGQRSAEATFFTNIDI